MRSFLSLLIPLFATLNHLLLADYVDIVIDSERPQASTLDKYAADHPDTYDFIAKTLDGRIIIQIRFENDTLGAEGYFTETPALLADLDHVQESILSLISSQGASHQFGSDGHRPTLQSAQSWRYGDPANEKRDLEDRHERPDDKIDPLTKRGVTCGRYCNTRFNCIERGCRRCNYAGGFLRWHKVCLRPPTAAVIEHIISHDILAAQPVNATEPE
ncbi:hypothetical protein I302_105848 [Kwoniella bestiolae CBS 10118]|uniref:Uncharacterized protein n=1 Tax=Kwoniella bestiolae CBS 10118 TaxID=1296100 RepID=A0A1B9G2A5_9TREE|nr:hypothetical protein I302_04972 [Kwoniella bestiolae CBS 10118]OCF25162.1 hypothetical protein I302_04972 [Kwoniella bestiolae CBS 10118]